MQRVQQVFSYGVPGNEILPEVEFIIDKEKGQATIKKQGRSIKMPLAILEQFVQDYTGKGNVVWETIPSSSLHPTTMPPLNLASIQPIVAPQSFEPRPSNIIPTCSAGANGPAGPTGSDTNINLTFSTFGIPVNYLGDNK